MENCEIKYKTLYWGFSTFFVVNISHFAKAQGEILTKMFFVPLEKVNIPMFSYVIQ